MRSKLCAAYDSHCIGQLPLHLMSGVACDETRAVPVMDDKLLLGKDTQPYFQTRSRTLIITYVRYSQQITENNLQIDFNDSNCYWSQHIITDGTS